MPKVNQTLEQCDFAFTLSVANLTILHRGLGNIIVAKSPDKICVKNAITNSNGNDRMKRFIRLRESLIRCYFDVDVVDSDLVSIELDFTWKVLRDVLSNIVCVTIHLEVFYTFKLFNELLCCTHGFKLLCIDVCSIKRVIFRVTFALHVERRFKIDLAFNTLVVFVSTIQKTVAVTSNACIKSHSENKNGI